MGFINIINFNINKNVFYTNKNELNNLVVVWFKNANKS